MVLSFPSAAPAHLVCGKAGEDVAVAHLLRLGHRLLGRNVRCGKGELDVVSYDPRTRMVVFTEVKTRRCHSRLYPIHTAVTRRKRAALRRSIDVWITEHDYAGPARIDIIGVRSGVVVEHLLDAGSDFFVDF